MKKIKSIVSVLLVSMMLFAVAAAGIGSASAAETNYNGGIIQYTVTDGKATITNVVGTDSDITVPATLDGYPVVAIGELAYREEHNLKSVVIPASIETIGISAFTGCTALETVTFADGSKVKTIEETAFNACKSLKNINFGKNGSLETIGRSAFVNCTALETFNPPASLKTIDATVFEGCTSLKNVTVSANVENIGNGAFAKCEALEGFKVDSANANFTTDSWGILYNKDKTKIVAYPAGNKRPVYTIPAYITEVQNSAFMGAINLEEVSWLNPETKFGLSTFSHCTNLYRVTVPEGTLHLSDWIFNACFSLTEVNLPDSVESFGAGVFHWCTGLTEFTMPANLIEVSSNSFKECFNLKKVVLNDSLLRIGPNAFARCSALEEINLHENITQIGDTAFYQCYSLRNFTFPSKVRYVNTEVLRYCYGLESVTFSPNAYEIDTEALMDCRGLETVNVPASVRYLYGKSFTNCVSLEKINIDPANKYYKTVDDVVYSANGKNLIYYPAAKTGSVFVVPDTTEKLNAGSFISAQNLAAVVVPASVTFIGDNAFDGYNIRDIYFEGTEEQWNGFWVADDEALKNVAIHFNHKNTDHIHDYTQTITVTPTCSQMGKKEFTCSCGESVTLDWHYASSRKLCLDSRFVFSSSTDSDCTSQGKNVYICSECSKITEENNTAKIGHNFEVSVTDTKIGYKCKDCNHTYDEPIPDGAHYVTFVYPDKEYTYILNPGEKLIHPRTPVKDGLDFAFWIDSAGKKVDVSVMPDKNVVLEPFFEKNMKENVYGVSVKFDENCFAEGYDVDLVVDDVDIGREQGAILIKDNESVLRAVKLMDIGFTYTDDEGKTSEIQPQEGKTVEVSFPVPEGFETCREFLIFHYHKDELYDKIYVSPVDGIITLTVDRFSQFEIYAKAYITLETAPAKLRYSYKEALDVSGLSLLVTDDSGNQSVVSDTSKMKITGYDPNKVGTQTISVEYEGVTVQFNVTVEYTWWQKIIRILLLGFLWY